MSYTVNLPTTGIAHPAATVDAAKAYARSRGAKRLDDVDQFITTVWDRSKAMGIRPEIAFGQWCDETGVGTSSYWKNNLNPGGLRITYDGEHSNTWADGNTAALGMLHRLSLYIYGYEHQAIPDGKQYDPQPEEVGKAGYLGIAKHLSDLSGHWAANPNYAVQIAGHLNHAFPDGDDAVFTIPVEHPEGGTSLELKPYAIAGTDQQIWSPVPIEVNLVPASHTNQRPGYALVDPHRCVQHETGNPGYGADADMHHTWLYNGADGSQLSFHFVTDDHKIIQLVPVDEVTWQAADGNGVGNFNGLSNEGCVNADGDMALMRRNAEYLMGGLAAIFDMPDEYMERHYDFNWADPDRHYCPQYMMQQGYWPTFQAKANAIKAKYKDGTISGAEPIPVPTPYAKPHVWPWMTPSDPGFGKDHTANGTRFFFVPQTYIVTATTGRQATASPDSPPAGPDIAVGTHFNGHYVFRSNADQQTYTMTKVTANGGGNRILSKKLLPKVQITKSGTVTVREMPNAAPTIVRKQGKPV